MAAPGSATGHRMALTTTEWIIVMVAVGLGSVTQSALGFGLNVIVAPVAALIDPDLVPAPMLVVGTIHLFTLGWAEREHLRLAPVGWVTLGRVPGVVIAVLLLSSLDRSAIEVLFGVALLSVTAMSLYRRGLPPTRRNLLGAGAVAGVTGTTVAVGGPPIALVLAGSDRPRSDITSVLMVGTTLSLLGLFLAGELAWSDVRIAAALLPAMVVGLAAGRVVAHRLDADRIRVSIYAMAAVAALVLLVRGLT